MSTESTPAAPMGWIWWQWISWWWRWQWQRWWQMWQMWWHNLAGHLRPPAWEDQRLLQRGHWRQIRPQVRFLLSTMINWWHFTIFMMIKLWYLTVVTIIRAVLVDLEPGTMDSVRSGPYGQVEMNHDLNDYNYQDDYNDHNDYNDHGNGYNDNGQDHNEIITRSSVRTTLSSVRAELATTGLKATTPRVSFLGHFFWDIGRFLRRRWSGQVDAINLMASS